MSSEAVPLDDRQNAAAAVEVTSAPAPARTKKRKQKATNDQQTMVYVCDFCKRSFLHLSNLRRHMRTHTGERPYKCTVCERAFTQKTHLVDHMRTHTGARPYVCSICMRAFAYSTGLRNHLRTHSGERPYACTECELRFACRSQLTCHLRTHSGEKPYSCVTCGKTFARSDSLRQHARLHMPDRPTKARRVPRARVAIAELSSGGVSRPVRRNVRPAVVPSGRDSPKEMPPAPPPPPPPPPPPRWHRQLSQKPHRCRVCDVRFACAYTLARHRHVATVRPLQCATCGVQACSAAALCLHLSTHAGGGRVGCRTCGESPAKCVGHAWFRRAARRRRATRRQAPCYACARCDVRFWCATTLEQHVGACKATEERRLQSVDSSAAERKDSVLETSAFHQTTSTDGVSVIYFTDADEDHPGSQIVITTNKSDSDDDDHGCHNESMAMGDSFAPAIGVNAEASCSVESDPQDADAASQFCDRPFVGKSAVKLRLKVCNGRRTRAAKFSTVCRRDKPFCCVLCMRRFASACRIKMHVRRHWRGPRVLPGGDSAGIPFSVVDDKGDVAGTRELVDSTAGLTHQTTAYSVVESGGGGVTAVFENSETVVDNANSLLHVVGEPLTSVINGDVVQVYQLLPLGQEGEEGYGKVLGPVNPPVPAPAAPRVQPTVFTCGKCGDRFVGRAALSHHQRRVHWQGAADATPKPFPCPSCDRTFASRSLLAVHERMHTGVQPYVCDVCARGFSHASNLKRHIRTHTGERPFLCVTCDKSFAQSSHLADHQRTHTGARPCVCPVCERSLSNNTALRNHMRTHSGERPYACPECERAFACHSQLTHHRRRHTGEKPYECGECGRKFSRKHTLVMHGRTHAQVEYAT